MNIEQAIQAITTADPSEINAAIDKEINRLIGERVKITEKINALRALKTDGTLYEVTKHKICKAPKRHGLKPDQRETIYTGYLAGMSIDEIVENTGLTRVQVQSCINAGRNFGKLGQQ